MTLNKHRLQGIAKIRQRTMSRIEFESLLSSQGYYRKGSAPANGERLKVWYGHATYDPIESIHSGDGRIVITAYHPAPELGKGDDHRLYGMERSTSYPPLDLPIEAGSFRLWFDGVNNTPDHP